MAGKSAEFSYRNIQLYKSESLGSGSYGGVCKAKCDGLLCAAKIMHPTLFDLRDPGTGSYLRKFREECHLLSLARHPNVVQYLGTYTDPDTRLPVLLVELCDESLTAFLERSPGPLSYHTQVNICHDIALALVYLHSNGLIHRDLTGNNVLIIAGPRAKITDFGMSKLASVNHRMKALTLCPGNALYMSPEALDEAKSYTAKLDIFSLGVIAIQVLTRQFPNPTDRFKKVHIKGFEEVRAVVPEIERRQAHLQLIPDTHPLRPLALQCLNKKENERPAALQISERLSQLKLSSQYTTTTTTTTNSADKSQKRVQQLEGKLEEMRFLTEVKERENEECHAQIAQLANLMEKQVQEHNSKRTAWDEVLGGKTRELQDTQERLESSKWLVVEHQQRLEQKDKTISDLQQIIIESERKSQQQGVSPACSHVPQQEPVTAAHKDIDKMRWKEGGNGPMRMWRGAAAVHGTTAYFRPGNSRSVFTYRSVCGKEQWSLLPDVPNESGGLIVIQNLLTSVGGRKDGLPTNTLLSLATEDIIREWREIFPPMPTSRRSTACAATTKALVVAGGYGRNNHLDTVEVLSLSTQQWMTVPSLSQKCSSLSAVVCGDRLYMAGGITEYCFSKSVFTCSLPDLVSHDSPRSIKPSSCCQCSSTRIWHEVCSLPVTRSTLVQFGDDLLAIGGRDDSTKDPSSRVYRYNSHIDSWTALASQMNTRRSACLAADISEDHLIVVGGFTSKNVCVNSATNSAEILK